jgi:hypothetical protein
MSSSNNQRVLYDTAISLSLIPSIIPASSASTSGASQRTIEFDLDLVHVSLMASSQAIDIFAVYSTPIVAGNIDPIHST